MLTADHISKLWIKMVRIYGHRWLTNFGKADDGTWLTGLKRISVEQLAEGITACITNGSDWPPSLPEFRAMCLKLPNVETLVQGALGTSNDPDLCRLRRTVDSFSRNSLSRPQLASMYRVNAVQFLKQLQDEKIESYIADNDRTVITQDAKSRIRKELESKR